MTDTVTIKGAPAPLLEAARRVTEDGDRPTLMVDGRAVALVTVEDAEALEAWEDARDVQLAEEAMEESRRSGEPNVPAEDLFRELEREDGMTPEDAEASMKAFVDHYRAASAEPVKA